MPVLDTGYQVPLYRVDAGGSVKHERNRPDNDEMGGVIDVEEVLHAPCTTFPIVCCQ